MVEHIHDLAEQQPDVIRQQIDETRSAITEKLEALEEQMVDTVQTARASVQETLNTVKKKVQETVGTVKETVQETVTAVKETFDVRLQVQRHPWPMVGGSFLAGLITGALLGEARQGRQKSSGRIGIRSMTPIRPLAAEFEQEEGILARRPGLLDRFQDEIQQLKGMALGLTVGVVRDVIKDNLYKDLPDVAEQVGEVIDRITTKLGGQPVRGPVFPHEEAVVRSEE